MPCIDRRLRSVPLFAAVLRTAVNQRDGDVVQPFAIHELARIDRPGRSFLRSVVYKPCVRRNSDRDRLRLDRVTAARAAGIGDDIVGIAPFCDEDRITSDGDTRILFQNNAEIVVVEIAVFRSNGNRDGSDIGRLCAAVLAAQCTDFHGDLASAHDQRNALV